MKSAVNKAIAVMNNSTKTVVRKKSVKKKRGPSVRKYCPGGCGRESRRCNRCKGSSGVSLCKHGKEWFRARQSCCPSVQKRTQDVTIMPVNKNTIAQIAAPHVVGIQCTLHIIERKDGRHMARVSAGSSVQDMREILGIKDDVDLRVFAGNFDLSSLQALM